MFGEQCKCGSCRQARPVRGQFPPGSEVLLEPQSYLRFCMYDLPLPATGKKERLDHSFKENLSLELEIQSK